VDSVSCGRAFQPLLHSATYRFCNVHPDPTIPGIDRHPSRQGDKQITITSGGWPDADRIAGADAMSDRVPKSTLAPPSR